MEDCVIDRIECRISEKDAELYSWKCGPLTLDGKTLREDVLDYFGLSEYGDKTIYLYAPEYKVELWLGSVRADRYQSSSHLRITTYLYKDNESEPEWAE